VLTTRTKDGLVNRQWRRSDPRTLAQDRLDVGKRSNTGEQSAINCGVHIGRLHVAGRDMLPCEAQTLFLNEKADAR
jgi:hypothetical protein